MLFRFLFTVIEVSSGEYGDVVPRLVKAWKAHQAAESVTLFANNNNNENSNPYFKQMMVSILPRCAVKGQSNRSSVFGGVSQFSQVGNLVHFYVKRWKVLITLIIDQLSSLINQIYH